MSKTADEGVGPGTEDGCSARGMVTKTRRDSGARGMVSKGERPRFGAGADEDGYWGADGAVICVHVNHTSRLYEEADYNDNRVHL